MRLLDHGGARRPVLDVDGHVLDLGRTAAGLDGLERPRADETDARLRRPPDVDDDRVPEAGCLPTSRPSCSSRSTRSQLSPASSREASPAAMSAVRTVAPNSTVSIPFSADEPGEDVDAGLGRRVERRVVGDVDAGGAVAAEAFCERAPPRPSRRGLR